jgi:hypothetical protein
MIADEAGDDRITAYDLDTLAQIDSVLLRGEAPYSHMIRWGARGLALRNIFGRIVLLEGDIVAGR